MITTMMTSMLHIIHAILIRITIGNTNDIMIIVIPIILINLMTIIIITTITFMIIIMITTLLIINIIITLTLIIVANSNDPAVGVREVDAQRSTYIIS